MRRRAALGSRRGAPRWPSLSCSSSPRASPGCSPCPPRTARRGASRGPHARSRPPIGRPGASRSSSATSTSTPPSRSTRCVYATALLSGEGSHPPADACDYARWCSAVDFFSINDHAEGLTPARWEETQAEHPPVQRGGGRSREPRPRGLPRLRVDAGGPHAGDALRPPQRDLPRPRRRRGGGAPDHRAAGRHHRPGARDGARARGGADRPRRARRRGRSSCGSSPR